jgi:hypothetical protein
MFGNVRQRFRDNEVCGLFDRWREAFVGEHVHVNPNWCAIRERLDGGGQARLGQDLWVNSMGQLPQFRECVSGRGRCLIKTGKRRWVDVFTELGSGQAKRKRHGNESLLRTIVKIALDALALRIAGRDDPSAGGSYLLKLRVNFCGEARVVVAHPDRGRDGGNQAPVLEQGRIMHDCGKGLVRSFDECHGSPRVGW